MRIVILGASRLGQMTGRKLADEGHDVVFVDTDRDVLETLGEELDCGLIRGDGTGPAVLRDALGDGADAFVALTSSDTVNTLAAAVARSVGFPRVIPQLVSPDLLPVLDELGISEAVAPVDSVADTLVATLTAHCEASPATALRHDLRMVTHDVPKKMDGSTLGDLDLPERTRIAAHVRGEVETLADADVTLKEGDQIIVVGHVDTLDHLERAFRR